MAEVVKIKVETVGYDTVNNELNSLLKLIDTLNKRKVAIKINTDGVRELNKEERESLKIQAQALKASAEKIRADAQKIRARADLKRAEHELELQEKKNLQIENQAVLELRKRETAEKQAKTEIKKRETAEKQTELAIQKGTAAEKQRKLAIERGNQAQKQRKLQEERTRTAIEQGNTALKKRELQEEHTRTATEKRLAAEARARKEEERTAQAKEKTAQLTLRQAEAQRKANAENENGVKTTNLLSSSLSSIVARYLSLSVIIYKVTSAFRDALQTMKEVDSALVTIQKTTGYTGERLEQLTKNAYELASAYGRTATEILNAASVYARAGFKDNLEQMTELSALLQNVGDLEGETAAKFLVSANAAWKLNGSYDALLSIIDGLNEQTNQAAVDMEGLTSGITVAGSVFAAAGESVQTFAGLLGTTIAVTQRSGSEVGRGLRTIAMNIRQIKGELDDGEIIDEASISDAAKALHSIGISVADKNGELRMTSAVLNELAGKWNKLTTAEQSYIAQSLAGKRQANILVSLMRNWDEAQRQMALYANGAGSAMKENEIYLNSWEAKTKQLSASWTKFVSDIVDTDMIKGALDGIISLVNSLDSQMGRTVVTAGALSLAISGIASAVAKVVAVIAAHPMLLGLLGGAAAVTAILTAIVNSVDSVVHATEKWTKAAQESWDKFSEINAEIDSLKTKTGELTEVEQNRLAILQAEADAAKEEAKAKALSAYYSEFISGTTNLPDVAGKGIQIQPKSTDATEAGKVYGNIFGLSIVGTGAKTGTDESLQKARELVKTWHELQNAMKTAEGDTFRKLEQEANDTVISISNMASQLNDLVAILGDEMPQAGQDALTILVTFLSGINKTRDGVESLGDGLDNLEGPIDEVRRKLQSFSENATTLDTVIGAVTEALEKYGDGSVEVYDAMRNLESTIPGSTAKLYDFETASLLSGDALDGTKSSLLDLIDAEKQVNFQNAISEFERASAAALELAGSIAMAMPGGYNEQFLDAFKVGENNASLQKLKQQKADWDAYIATLRERGDYRGGGGGYSHRTPTGEDTTDTELQRLQNIVALRKQELSFLQAKGASQDEINAKQKEIQGALHDVAEHLRLSEAYLNGDEKALAEVLALSTEWWQIQKQIDDTGEDILQQHKDNISLLKSELDFLKASGKSDEEIIAKQKEIQKALHAQAEYMRSIGANQADINALSTEWWNIQNDILSIQEAQVKKQQELFDTLKKTIDDYYDTAVTDKKKELEYEEKILEVQKAEAALANAQKERTVRFFNASSGQWEWGANQKNVKSAQDNLKKAQEALTNYQTEQAWIEFKSAWEYIAGQIRSGDVTFAEAYQYMYDKMTGIQDKYDVDMSGVLNDSIGGFKGINKTIKDFDSKTAKELSQSVGQITAQNKNLSTATGNAREAVGKLKTEFENLKKRIQSGDISVDTAFAYFKTEAKKISDRYGVDLTGEVDEAIGKFQTIYSGLNGISQAVQEGALTPAQAFDIISKALNAVSTEYGEDISGEVSKILKEDGGFEDGLDGLAKAVADGKITWADAFKLLTGAVDKTSEKFGIKGLQGTLDTAITNMGKSGTALDDLWKTIVTSKMRANSISWLELDAQEKKAKAAGDTATVDAIQKEKARLHSENEALGQTIGATYDKSGYWNLNGQQMYDPKAEAEKSAALATTGAGGGGGGGGTSTAKTAGGTDTYADHILSILGKTLKLPSIDENGQLQVSFQGFDKVAGSEFETWTIGDADKEKKFYSQVQSLYKSGDVSGAISLMKAHGNTGFYDANGNYYGWVIGYDGASAKTWQPVLGGKIISTGQSDTDIWLTPDGKILNGTIGGKLTDNGLTWTTSHTTGDFLDNSWMSRMNELGISYADIFNAKAAHGDFTNPELNTAEGNMRAYLRFTTKPDMMDEEDWARISQIFTPEFIATFLAAALAGGVNSGVGTAFIESLLGLDSTKVYDSGGILHGTGGIKATARDELVLPPDITERLLSPVGNNIVRDRMDDLREILGMRPESGTTTSSTIGTQNNGDTYMMNGVTLTEGAARTTTVYDLAQMARSLGAYQRS